MDFLRDFELFKQILVSPNQVTLVYIFSFSSMQITKHIKINLSLPISYLHICIFLLLTYFLLTDDNTLMIPLNDMEHTHQWMWESTSCWLCFVSRKWRYFKGGWWTPLEASLITRIDILKIDWQAGSTGTSYACDRTHWFTGIPSTI